MKKLLSIVLSVVMIVSVITVSYVSGTTYSYNVVQDFDGFAENEISRGGGHTKNEKGVKTRLVKNSSSVVTTKGNTSSSTGEFIAYGKDGTMGFKAWSGATEEYIEVYVPVTAEMRQGAVGFRVWAYNRSLTISAFQLRFYAKKDGTEYVYRKAGYTMDKLQGGYLELFFNDPEIAKHSQTPNYTNVADSSKVPDVSSYNMSEDLTYIGLMVKTGSTGAIGFDNFEIISSDAPVAETTVPTEEETTTTTTTTTSSSSSEDLQDVEIIRGGEWVPGFWRNGAVDNDPSNASNNKRLSYNAYLKVEPNSIYTIKTQMPSNSDYANAINLKEYDADKNQLSNANYDAYSLGANFTKKITTTATTEYITITLWNTFDNNSFVEADRHVAILRALEKGAISVSIIGAGTVEPEVPSETESTTTTTTTTTTTQTPSYNGDTAIKELITDDNWVQGFWTSAGIISTEQDIHKKRIAYAEMLAVLPNTTYTFTAKLPKPYGLNTKQYGADKAYITDSNKNFDEGQTSYTLTTGPSTYYLVLSARHTNSGAISSLNGLPVYQALLNNFLDNTFTLSIVGEVPVDSLEVSSTMKQGAGLRLGTVNGIRFSTQVDAEKIASLKAKGAQVQAGTLIAPADYLNGQKLTFDIGENKYLDVQFDLDNDYYDGKNTIVGSIVNIKESGTAYSEESGNITRKFVGRGYVKVTLDGRTYITYSNYYNNEVAQNSRSLKYLASAFKSDDSQEDLYQQHKEKVDKWANTILAEISISDEMVGGNIIVQNIVENADGTYTATVKNDLRTTTEDWMYWAFKVEGAQGKKVTFKFTQSNRVGPYGAAVSHDLENWEWTNTRSGEGFTYTFGKDETTVYFAHSMLYHPERFNDVADELGLKVQTLCTSEKGRAVPYVRFGNGDKGIVLTARHHACESTGSYILEGVLRQLATSDYIKENYTVMVVPFVDYDGVVDGDQGKMRAPHDHNRDYTGGWGNSDESIYASVRAIRKYLEDPANNVVQAYDSHSPWHTGGENDSIFVYKKFAPGTEQANNLETLLTNYKNNIDSSCLPYNGAHDQEYGAAGNTGTDGTESRAFSSYMKNIPTLLCGTTFETAYFKSNGVKFSQANAVNSGKALGKAIISLAKELDK